MDTLLTDNYTHNPSVGVSAAGPSPSAAAMGFDATLAASAMAVLEVAASTVAMVASAAATVIVAVSAAALIVTASAAAALIVAASGAAEFIIAASTVTVSIKAASGAAALTMRMLPDLEATLWSAEMNQTLNQMLKGILIETSDVIPTPEVMSIREVMSI